MHGLSHLHGGPDPVLVAYEQVGAGGGGAAAAAGQFAIATNKTLTIIQGTTTSTYPYAAFATSDPALFTLDPTLGTIKAAGPGFYELQAKVTVFANSASIPAGKHLSLDVPQVTTGGDSRLSEANGQYQNVIGIATAAAGSNGWYLHYRAFYTVASSLCQFGFRVIAEAATANWANAVCVCTVVRLGDPAPSGTNIDL
jgi:hypothetical protein